eukprot:1113775-Pyramimonas_sp.AAC.1
MNDRGHGPRSAHLPGGRCGRRGRAPRCGHHSPPAVCVRAAAAPLPAPPPSDPPTAPRQTPATPQRATPAGPAPAAGADMCRRISRGKTSVP